jgi:anhydro-N-acetylmuramic acid kinase
MRAIGLMSGTSLDGIDAALVDIVPRGHGYGLEVNEFVTHAFEPAFHERLRAALPPNAPAPARVAALDRDLGERFADAAAAVTRGAPVDYVASHGLTLHHDGGAHVTAQIGDPYLIRDRCEASVVFDFRRADCAQGGTGAPLVPYVDALLFASPLRDVVALNLGGIANVTVLARGAPAAAALAWDTGPGNMLIDAFVYQRTAGAERFDRDGAHAARGSVDERAVAELVAREAFYLMVPPPKSTGRERFGTQLLDAHADLFAQLSLQDGCATLAAFTATTVMDALANYAPSGARVVVSGGGTRNSFIMARLAERVRAGGGELLTSAAYGIDPDAKEAIAFAVLGYETLRGRPANVALATGARRPAVLGAIVPHDLAALLEKVRAETASVAGAGPER